MIDPKSRILIAFGTLLLVLPSIAQEAASVPVSVLQQKTKEWITTRRLISEEAAAWKTEKATLAELNAIRAKETSQLDEFILAAGSRVGELSEKRAQAASERDQLKKWRGEFEAGFAKLEADTRKVLARFPVPLRDKIDDTVQRIEEADPERPLQDRVRDVLLVLQSAKEFDDTFTVTSEIREVGGKEIEVRILYLGLSQAWYVDAAATLAGYGQPGANGWTWTEDRSIAASVRDAIAIQTGEATAAFVTLPFVPLPSAPASETR
jgi:hypothetical protein